MCGLTWVVSAKNQIWVLWKKGTWSYFWAISSPLHSYLCHLFRATASLMRSHSCRSLILGDNDNSSCPGDSQHHRILSEGPVSWWVQWLLFTHTNVPPVVAILLSNTNKQKTKPGIPVPWSPTSVCPSSFLISVIHTHTALWKSRNAELNASFLLRLNRFWFLGSTAWAGQGQPLPHSTHWITVHVAASLEPWFSVNTVCPAGAICQL